MDCYLAKHLEFHERARIVPKKLQFSMETPRLKVD
jgi:hypothetical protein